MVYRGKPSPGCALCRKRRLKCDQRQPSCSQCLRIKKECPGYQDPRALRIYDQTTVVTAKALARAAVTRKAAQSPTSESSKTPPLSYLSTPIQEQAMSHIFKFYVGTSQNRGVLPYLSDLLNADPSGALQATVKAVGLACMAGIHHLPGLRRLAAEEYSKALQATNLNLQDTASATSDSTLGAVVTLSLYEIISGHESQMMDAWLNHARGAIKLLELRGVKQFESPTGLGLFNSARLQIAMMNKFFRTTCYSSSTITALSNNARTLYDTNSQAIDDFYNILIMLNDLSIRIKEAYKNDGFRGNIAPLIAQALRLDADMVSWASSLGLAWQFTVASNSPSFSNGGIPVCSYDKVYHVYPSINVAVLWNHYRQARIVLHEMIRTMCLRASERQAMPQSQQIMLNSSAINKQLVKDVCDSVPHFFTSGEAGFGGVARLPWPLFVAADCTDISSNTKDWIAQILDIIATSAGVQQARILSHLIKQGHHGFNLIPGKCKQ
ncbi:hypothetical protein BDV32DRAFT_144732 [Aspergillus pseudonomiae]|uniref:Uncharacterized protein n=1 Tax=Aspergillus pseudonomiae TaxID=1506151 RepID=A0A5N6IHX4_9EURO|nr:uncharacterized protein BDV37DRAFT_228531 [Aspergillus pseudonomiae]KAB8265439.1 hypothetical protein BDV32DRAFT_144732 [Aspergillus pseudonomiae]KAE8399554.1 hypothetical protein BDV37DRAFT_228531 [Aspergillus pseudonomiae]